jgi:hypothetical protein
MAQSTEGSRNKMNSLTEKTLTKLKRKSINFAWIFLIAALILGISTLLLSKINGSTVNVIVIFTILYFMVGFLSGYFKRELLNDLWIVPVFIGPNMLKVKEFGLIGCLYLIWFIFLNLFLLNRGGQIGREVREFKQQK